MNFSHLNDQNNVFPRGHYIAYRHLLTQNLQHFFRNRLDSNNPSCWCCQLEAVRGVCWKPPSHPVTHRSRRGDFNSLAVLGEKSGLKGTLRPCEEEREKPLHSTARLKALLLLLQTTGRTWLWAWSWGNQSHRYVTQCPGRPHWAI